jgi:hypothetical protein
VPDPGSDARNAAAALNLVAESASRFLDQLGDERALPAGADAAMAAVHGGLPEDGDGALAALNELIALGTAGATRSAGPRFFHFVTGGATPAALGADWLTSTFDQNTFAWISSPFGGRIEQVAIGWLKELFDLPTSHGGVLTTGATMLGARVAGDRRAAEPIA